MGAGSSIQGGDVEKNVYKAIRGVVLRGSKKISPLQDLLRTGLYHTYPDPAHRLSSLYVVRDGKEMEKFGLLPTFYGNKDRFIVRPLQREYIDAPKRFRKASDEVSEGAVAIYSVLATMIAITGLALASHTQNYKDMIDEISKDVQKTPVAQKVNYPELVVKSLITYSSQKYNKDSNPRERNVLFELDKYPLIITTMMDTIRNKFLKSRAGKGGGDVMKGDILLHTGVLQSIDSFSICSRNQNSLKNLLPKNGSLDAIVSKMYQVLSKDVVQKWLDRHPTFKNKLASIIAGTARSARLIGRDNTGLDEVIGKIMEDMRVHVEDACQNNERIATYTSKKNVLVKTSGTDKYEYSKEANRMVVRIYQNFESIVRKMQGEILNVFLSIFEISKEEMPNTISIQTTDGYLCVKPSILQGTNPGMSIMDGLLKIVDSYSKFVVNLQRTLKSTINRTTRVL